MARKDDDFFRKLNKEKPLVKRKELQPLSSRDFSPRKNANESLTEAGVGKKMPRGAQSGRVTAASKKPVLRSPAVRGADLANRYNQRQSSASASGQGLTVFGEDESTKKPPIKSSGKAELPKASPQTERNTKNAPSHLDNRTEAEKERFRHADLKIQDHNAFDAESYAASQPDKQPLIQRKQIPDSSLDLFSNHTRQAPVVREEAFGQAVASRTLDSHDAETAPDIQPAAGLSFRHELKYYINYRDYVLLKNTLKTLLPLDRFAGAEGDYHIRSLYFDDVYETALVDKMAGNDIRSKFRIRIYNFSDDAIKFEKKYKQGQYIAKSSLLISRDEYEALLAGECSFLADRKEPLAAEIFLQIKNNLLRPRVIVDYRREAYVSSFENVRITFDKDLKAGLWLTDIFNPNAPTMPVLETGTMVLEVKFNRYLPVFIKAVLNNVNAAQRSAVSKYVLCRKYD